MSQLCYLTVVIPSDTGDSNAVWIMYLRSKNGTFTISGIHENLTLLWNRAINQTRKIKCRIFFYAYFQYDYIAVEKKYAKKNRNFVVARP